MSLRVAINGFGRIGRNILRAGFDHPEIDFVHINDLTSDEMLAYLLRHDSVHGAWGDIKATAEGLVVNGQLIHTSAEADPRKLPWKSKEVDVVFECTGVFTSSERAGQHLEAGASRVIISAPATDIDATFVVGVNHDTYDPERHRIVSNASCTTNCLAPVASVLHEHFGIERGFMTTVHSYTMDQNLLDAAHSKGNFRRSRAAAQNMVPTSTGAATAIGKVLPELAGRLHGMAVRVPTPNVSMIDLVVQTRSPTTVEQVNAALEKASTGHLVGILEFSSEELVSSDMIGNPHSSIVDSKLTQVADGHLVKIITWYDNEWGFSNRMLDLARLLGGRT